MKQNNFTQQTHFIGALLPDALAPKEQTSITSSHASGAKATHDLTLTLQDCRRYMNEAYGCKSGHGTPIHVTLVPPFRLQEEYSTEDLARAIEKDVLPKRLGFSAHIENFDAFGDRTLFGKVIANDKWTKLRDETVKAVLNACPGCTKKDQKYDEPKKARCRSLSFNGSSINRFQPHATVANRDIPAGVTTEALQVMNELNLIEDFPVDNITIFERRGSKWEAAVVLKI